MTVGGNIRKYRERIGITQTELANKLGISSRTVSSWEVNRTEPKMGMLERVCMILNCKKSDIIEDTEYDTALSNENPVLLSAAKHAILSNKIHDLSDSELSDLDAMVTDYRMLNIFGQKEAVKRIHELTMIPVYVEVQNIGHHNEDNSLMPVAAHHAPGVTGNEPEAMEEVERLKRKYHKEG